MKKVLITGGAGYIGSHIAKHYLERKHPTVVLDNFSCGFREPLDTLSSIGNLDIEEADLRDIASVREVFLRHDIGHVIHCAGLCTIDESVREPDKYMENNVDGTKHLLEAMRESGVQNIIYSSSSEVYGEAWSLPIRESHPTNPLNPYGVSKLMAENIIRDYEKRYGFHYIIFRYFNVCGASSDSLIGDSKSPSLLLTQNAVRGAMKIAPFSYTCSTVDTPDGTPIRDYIDIEDLAEAHYLGHTHLESGRGSDTFNLGNGRGYSVKEIVTEVEKRLGTTIEKSKATQRRGEAARKYADLSKARTVLAFAPKRSIGDSIENLRRWYESHPNGYAR